MNENYKVLVVSTPGCTQTYPFPRAIWLCKIVEEARHAFKEASINFNARLVDWKLHLACSENPAEPQFTEPRTIAVFVSPEAALAAFELVNAAFNQLYINSCTPNQDAVVVVDLCRFYAQDNETSPSTQDRDQRIISLDTETAQTERSPSLINNLLTARQATFDAQTSPQITSAYNPVSIADLHTGAFIDARANDPAEPVPTPEPEFENTVETTEPDFENTVETTEPDPDTHPRVEIWLDPYLQAGNYSNATPDNTPSADVVHSYATSRIPQENFRRAEAIDLTYHGFDSRSLVLAVYTYWPGSDNVMKKLTNAASDAQIIMQTVELAGVRHQRLLVDHEGFQATAFTEADWLAYVRQQNLANWTNTLLYYVGYSYAVTREFPTFIMYAVYVTPNRNLEVIKDPSQLEPQILVNGS